MTEELQRIYNQSIEKPLQVLTIFNEFFGEDRVDLQGIPALSDIPDNEKYTNRIDSYIRRNTPNIFILVHFPRVKVTNEYDKYTYINHLYAKVPIDLEGKLTSKFSLNRAEYTVVHFTNNYMHSHISCIPIDDFTQFQTPCTGRGPINNTICSLIHGFDEDLWRLFCLELDKFVQVESIAGVPYHKLEELSERRTSLRRAHFQTYYQPSINSYDVSRKLTIAQIAEFIKYVIDKDVLKFNYTSGRYGIAMSPTTLKIVISNAFIDWYNKEFAKGDAYYTFNELLDAGILWEYKFIGGQLWAQSRYQSNLTNYTRYVGKMICTFKGEAVTLSFSDTSNSQEEPETTTLILNDKLVSYVISKILNIINFRYGNNAENSNEKGLYFL